MRFAAPRSVRGFPPGGGRDNLDGSVERGYAGASLWDWDKLPDHIDPRYIDYARANASIGINGTVLNNVNANARALTPRIPGEGAALADVFRPYGIRVYLSANFARADRDRRPEDRRSARSRVAQWWRRRPTRSTSASRTSAASWSRPTPRGSRGRRTTSARTPTAPTCSPTRSAPHGGIVMWRAFVYNADVDPDRVKRAYSEFVPLDGTFRDNVLVQVKNGPLDFQPREPFHPLFGAMPRTPLMLELQITKEYLGLATHLVYLGTDVRGSAATPTPTRRAGVDGREGDRRHAARPSRTGIAGVANTGTDRNWSGSHFDQANWYAFGRLAWNPAPHGAAIADEWMRMTFTNDRSSSRR